MKVANIILDGRFGGPQNRILQVAEGLKNYGIETVVIFPKQDSDVFNEKLLQSGVTVKRMNLHRLTREKSHLISGIMAFFPELLSLYGYLKKERIQLVHCNGVWQITGILASKMAGSRTILHLNDTWTPLGIKILFKLLSPLCEAYILASERTQECYFKSREIKKKSIIIYPPVNTESFDPKKVTGDEKMRNSLGLNITTVGNITPTKGFEYFIEMADFLNKKFKHLSFYIIGPCFSSQENYLNKLKTMIYNLQLKNVFIYGKSDSITSVLKATDIFVCTSLSESGPMVVWEAMSMEKAVVSTDVGDLRFYIKNGKGGFLVPTCNSQALAERVGILINDEELRISMGKYARKTVVESLDIKICIEKHRKFYLDIFN